MSVPQSRILLTALGTRGDVQPFCVLGRALLDRGHAVSFLTSRDYDQLIARFGIPRLGGDVTFADALRDPDVAGVVRNYFGSGLQLLSGLRRVGQQIRGDVTRFMLDCARATASADLVVYNPFTFFAGEFARECGVPAARVTCQPMLPSRERPLCLFGTRDWGRFGNRASYEIPRVLSPLLRGCVREVRRRTGLGKGLGLLANPVTHGARQDHQLLAFSATLAPPAGDWPAEVRPTGSWFEEPRPDERLPDEVAAFLAAGPAPLFVGFGSMFWGARRNTALVLEAVSRWGGRAIVSVGPDALPSRDELPPNVVLARGLNHNLLFPHVVAVVHHGGAGTTATALRHGRPNVILPVLGDQLYWGERVAALGAGEAPVPLSRITAEELAGRMARACTVASYSEAARALARRIGEEPGVVAAVEAIERRLAKAPGLAGAGDLPSLDPGIQA